MRRSNRIFALTHFYPCFIAGHLCFGDWCRVCQVMFSVVPAVCFGGLFYIWAKSSECRLSWSEKFNLMYLVYIMFCIFGYYSICIFSLPEWVYSHNVQVAAFVFLTAVFYLLFYVKLKRCEL